MSDPAWACDFAAPTLMDPALLTALALSIATAVDARKYAARGAHIARRSSRPR
jgi:hypothetical protein